MHQKASKLIQHFGNSQVLLAESFFVDHQSLPVHGFGFGHPVLDRDHVRQFIERVGDSGTFVAQQFPAHCQALLAVLFGLGQVAVVQTAVFFGLVQFVEMQNTQAHLAKEPGGISEADERSGDSFIFFTQPRSSELQTVAGHHFHLVDKPQVPVGASQGEAKLRFHLRLIGQGFADSLESFVQNVPQEGGIAAQGQAGANSFEHVLEQLRHLLAFLLLGFSDEAKASLVMGRACGADRLPGAYHGSNHQHGGYGERGSKSALVPANGLLQTVKGARWTSDDGFIAQVALDVSCQAISRLVPARTVLFQRLHHDPIQIS